MRRTDRIKKKQKPITPIKKQPKKAEAAAQMPVAKAKRGGIYDTQYKKLLLIPFLMLVFALVSIGIHYANTGDFINRGVSLKGGLQVSIPEGAVTTNLESALQAAYPENDIEIRTLEEAGTPVATTISADIATDEASIEEFLTQIQDITNTPKEDYSVETIGSSLGASFFKQTVKSLFIAFLFMGLVVFLYFGEGTNVKWIAAGITLIAAGLMYSSSSVLNIISALLGASLIVIYTRTSIPSVAVILAAFSDIVVTLAVTNIIGIKISTAGIAAFLMLIGYSVDTDILLSTRVLKRTGGTVYDRTINALKTGLTMNFTTLAAVIIGLIVAESAVITQIMTILFIGLIADMINTWLQNAGILRWHLERKEASA